MLMVGRSLKVKYIVPILIKIHTILKKMRTPKIVIRCAGVDYVRIN